MKEPFLTHCFSQAVLTGSGRQKNDEQAPTTPASSLPSLAGVRTLIVDDDKDTLYMISTLLVGLGAAITTAASGKEARAWLANSSFDVLVCDIAMPEEDGYEVLRRIRAHEREFGQTPLPAIALTGLARTSDRLTALKAGYQMYVIKPIEPMELALMMANLLGLRSF